MHGAFVTWAALANFKPADFLLLSVLLGLAAIVVWLVKRRRTPRIVIHPKSQLKIQAQGKKNCPACQEALDGSPVARCRADPSHVIHAQCKELVRGICPECRGRME